MNIPAEALDAGVEKEDPKGRLTGCERAKPGRENFLTTPWRSSKFTVLVLSDSAGRTVTSFGPFLPSFSSQVQLRYPEKF